MGIMIIDPNGNTIREEDERKERQEEQGDYVDPRLEEIVPDSGIIEKEIEDEQVIITTIIGPPPQI